VQLRSKIRELSAIVIRQEPVRVGGLSYHRKGWVSLQASQAAVEQRCAAKSGHVSVAIIGMTDPNVLSVSSAASRDAPEDQFLVDGI